MNHNYPEHSSISCCEELPPANLFSELIELILGATYPPNILARRVNLLTKAEKLKCDKNWRKIEKLTEEINDIISNRAEICNDPWKIIKIKNNK